MISVLLAIGALIGFPVLAWNGIGARGGYLFLGMMALIVGAVIAISIPSPHEYQLALESGDRAQIAGSEFLFDNGVPMAVTAFGLALGWLIAGAVFQKPKTPTKRCAFCAEEIQVAAAVCKHCGREQVAA